MFGRFCNVFVQALVPVSALGPPKLQNAVFRGGQNCSQFYHGNSSYYERCVRVYVCLTTVPSRQRNLLHKNGVVVTFATLLVAKFLQINVETHQSCNTCEVRVKLEKKASFRQSHGIEIFESLPKHRAGAGFCKPTAHSEQCQMLQFWFQDTFKFKWAALCN